MKKIKGKTIYDLYEVFTPSTPARATFIERQSVNNKLVEALWTPGKQIIVYGHSGSGKTTLLINKLDQVYEKYIITRCMAGMSFENILMHGFAELDKYYIDKIDSTVRKKVAMQIGAEYKMIKAQLSGEAEKSQTISAKPILPPLLTPQFLIKFYGELNCCWVLEDFHKISPEEKTKASQIMKVFMDSSMEYRNVKLIAIGAVNTGREVINFDKEMRQRLSQISVPLMLEEELNAIIEKGEEQLNIRFGTPIKEAIIRVSSGLASICHQLCLNCCSYKEVFETAATITTIDESALNVAFEMYVEENEDSIKQDYEEAVKKDGGVDELPEIILTAIARYKNEEMPYKTILKKIEFEYKDKNTKIEDLPLDTLMSELQKDSRGSVLSYNSKIESYSFANPFMRVYVQCVLKNNLINSSSNDRINHAMTMKMVEKMHKTFYERIYDDEDITGNLEEEIDDIMDR
jgi:energy-coupling factor transporter ATP-binding protein EcfA2